MKPFELESPVLLEFRGMERPVAVTLPQPALRYLDIYADCEHTSEGRAVYKQGVRSRILPECLLARRHSPPARP